MNKLVLILLLLFFNSDTTVEKNWTFLYYAGGSNSSEIDLMSDIDEMIRGKSNNSYNLLVLIDRMEGYSEDSLSLGQNFYDTRLYEIGIKGYKRISGREFLPEIDINSNIDLNMGDAKTLKKFIQFGKKYYPAKHFMLMARSHGNGWSMSRDVESKPKDRLFPAEITDILTQKESVDILGLDVCSMAGLENNYQWRPEEEKFGAQYILSSAPLSAAWAYDSIFKKLVRSKNAKTGLIDIEKADPLTLSKYLFDEVKKSQEWSSWALVDNSNIYKLKRKIDRFAIELSKLEGDHISEQVAQSYSYYHNTTQDLELSKLSFPYVDAYDFYSKYENNPNFNQNIRTLAQEILLEIDRHVVKSYHGVGYFENPKKFINGKSGIYQIIPMGNTIFSQTNKSFWYHTSWFSPEKIDNDPNSYGNYDWCLKRIDSINQPAVSNFYELLKKTYEN